MGTFAICARNAAKSLAWEFSRSGKLRKYKERTIFLQSKRIFCGALSVVSRRICGRPKKNLNWPQAMLQTKRPRSTLRSSCTSRFTRRFPPRWIKSRWNHSSCSDNSHTQTNTRTQTNTQTRRQTLTFSISLHVPTLAYTDVDTDTIKPHIQADKTHNSFELSKNTLNQKFGSKIHNCVSL